MFDICTPSLLIHLTAGERSFLNHLQDKLIVSVFLLFLQSVFTYSAQQLEAFHDCAMTPNHSTTVLDKIKIKSENWNDSLLTFRLINVQFNVYIVRIFFSFDLLLYFQKVKYVFRESLWILLIMLGDFVGINWLHLKCNNLNSVDGQLIKNSSNSLFCLHCSINIFPFINITNKRL